MNDHDDQTARAASTDVGSTVSSNGDAPRLQRRHDPDLGRTAGTDVVVTLDDEPAPEPPSRARAARTRGKETVARLLDAARDALAERSIAALRVDDVVELADTSHGTFYLYFTDKDDLLDALLGDARHEATLVSQRFPRERVRAGDDAALRAWVETALGVLGRHATTIRAGLGARPDLRIAAMVAPLTDTLVDAATGSTDPLLAAKVAAWAKALLCAGVDRPAPQSDDVAALSESLVELLT